MKSHRKQAKEKLLESTKTEFDMIIEESNVADENGEIAFLKLIKRESYVSLSIKYNCSVEHIRDVMKDVYDRVYRVIKGGLI